MHKISIYSLLKERLGILKVLLCIYLVFGFFKRVDLASFAYDYLATLVENTAALDNNSWGILRGEASERRKGNIERHIGLKVKIKCRDLWNVPQTYNSTLHS